MSLCVVELQRHLARTPRYNQGRGMIVPVFAGVLRLHSGWTPDQDVLTEFLTGPVPFLAPNDNHHGLGLYSIDARKETSCKNWTYPVSCLQPWHAMRQQIWKCFSIMHLDPMSDLTTEGEASTRPLGNTHRCSFVWASPNNCVWIQLEASIAIYASPHA